MQSLLMIKLGILGSTRGTHLQTLVHAIQQKILPASIEMVISNKADALILERARNYQLRAEFISPLNQTRECFDQTISAMFSKWNIDLVVLIGYMRILSGSFIENWKHKIINVHPSLLPAFAGKMDLEVHHAVLQSGVNETGCTVHYVTEKVDAGPILLQKKCPIFKTDTAEILKSRVQTLEEEALVQAIAKIILSYSPI